METSRRPPSPLDSFSHLRFSLREREASWRETVPLSCRFLGRAANASERPIRKPSNLPRTNGKGRCSEWERGRTKDEKVRRLPESSQRKTPSARFRPSLRGAIQEKKHASPCCWAPQCQCIYLAVQLVIARATKSYKKEKLYVTGMLRQSLSHILMTRTQTRTSLHRCFLVKMSCLYTRRNRAYLENSRAVLGDLAGAVGLRKNLLGKSQRIDTPQPHRAPSRCLSLSLVQRTRPSERKKKGSRKKGSRK